MVQRKRNAPAGAQWRAFVCPLAICLILFAMGCSTTKPWQQKARRWGVRGLGAFGSFALHEVCHLALGAAFGADISASFNGRGLHLGFDDISSSEHRAVALAGNACTGLVAEIIVDTDTHKRSDFAWGFAVFHAVNAFGYAFAESGDARHWGNGEGKQTTWRAVNATHGARIAAHLGWDAGIGNYVIRLWRPPLPSPKESSPWLSATDEEAQRPPTLDIEAGEDLVWSPLADLDLESSPPSPSPGDTSSTADPLRPLPSRN